MATSTLDALLGALAVEIEAFAICEIGDEVALIFPPIDAIEVHHVLEGTLYLRVGDNEPLVAGPGSMILAPPGNIQFLAATPDTIDHTPVGEVCIPVREGMLQVDTTDGKPTTLRIACGAVVPNREGSYGPLEGLVRPVAEDLSDVAVVSTAFSSLLEEVASPMEGTRALTSALMKACLVVLLRRHIHSSRDTGAVPALIHDVRLGRAIATVLDRPAAAHSVDTLAKEAGMSRSAFSREFKASLGMTPKEYVSRVRMGLAHRLLTSTGIRVEAVAATVGFSSRSHFSSAFREHFGIDPSSLRRQNKENG